MTATTPALSRRSFLGAAIAAGATTALLPRFAFATGTRTPDHVLIVVNLCGGLDGLSAVVPVEAGYYDRRPTIAVPDSELLPMADGFGLHPALAPLHDLWRAGRMAAIPGTGTPTGSRSHFAEQDLIGFGVGDLQDSAGSGWLARHVLSRPGGPGVGLPSAAIASVVPTNLTGLPSVAATTNIGNFRVGGIRWRDTDRTHAALRAMYDHAEDQTHAVGQLGDQAAAALDTIDLLADSGAADIEPGNGVTYPTHRWGRSLQQVAQLVRADLGLEVAGVDFGGFDTHVSMGTAQAGQMRNLLTDLASAVGAFFADLAGHSTPVTMVIMSEFGRRVAENANRGTDHGRGGIALVLGDGAIAGVHGTWPGLADSVLDRGDVPTVTDYRDVLAELVAGPLGNDDLATVFPGHTPAPAGAAG